MKNKIILSAILIAILLLIIVASQVLTSTQVKFKPPTNGFDATHYELGQDIEVKKISIKIERLEKIDDRWFIKGNIDDSDYITINDNYTFMFGNNDIIVKGSTSNVINQKEIYMVCGELCDFNQIMLIENRTGKVLAVINL